MASLPYDSDAQVFQYPKKSVTELAGGYLEKARDHDVERQQIWGLQVGSMALVNQSAMMAKMVAIQKAVERFDPAVALQQIERSVAAADSAASAADVSAARARAATNTVCSAAEVTAAAEPILAHLKAMERRLDELAEARPENGSASATAAPIDPIVKPVLKQLKAMEERLERLENKPTSKPNPPSTACSIL